MKKLIYSLSFILVCFFIAFFLFINNTFNTKRIKNDINAYFQQNIQKYQKHYSFKDKELSISVDGAVSFKVFPKVKLIVNNVNIKNIQYNSYILNGNIKDIEFEMKFADIIFNTLKPKNIIINNAFLTAEKNILPDFYYKKERVKKLVKLEQNEVLGVKSKLKELLTGRPDEQKVELEGYKEVYIEESKKIDLDNTANKAMFEDLVKHLSLKNNMYAHSDIEDIKVINSTFNLVKNKNIEKEAKNIHLNIKSTKNNINTHINGRCILASTQTDINGTLKKEIDKDNNNKATFKLDLTINNDINDKVEFKYVGNDAITDMSNLLKINGDKKLSFETKSLNTFLQWILPYDSNIINLVNYNDALKFSVDYVGNSLDNNIKLNNIAITSNDLQVSGNIIKSKEINKIDLQFDKINLNNFSIINNVQKQANIRHNDIKIFELTNLNKLQEFIKADREKSKQISSEVNLTIKELIYKNNIVKDSKLAFNIVDGNYKISDFNINIDDINLSVNNSVQFDDIYVNDLNIKGTDFSRIANLFEAKNLFDIKDFNILSKIVIYNNIIYLYGLKLNNNEQVISGNAEISMLNNKKYFAFDLNINKLEYKSPEQAIQYNTIKEELLKLNNIKHNIFARLQIDNLKFNNVENIQLKTFANYRTGYISLYNIENINIGDKIKDLSGNITVNITQTKPIINIDLSVKNSEVHNDLLKYVINVNKYKGIILDDLALKQESKTYWVNKLFELPSFVDIYGDIKIKLNNFNLNTKTITDLNFDSKIENGVIKINNFTFNGLGGKTEIKGFVGLADNKAVNLGLNETIYNLEDVLYILTNSDKQFLTGVIGISGAFTAKGHEKSVFLSSMSIKSNFIAKNLSINGIGLKQLQKTLNSYVKDKNADVGKLVLKDKIFNNKSNTNYENVNGKFFINKNLVSLFAEGESKNYSSNISLKIDNNKNDPIIDMNNVNSLIVNIGNKRQPLYYSTSFNEDFNNKATLNMDLKQLEEFVNIIKKRNNKTKQNANNTGNNK